MYISTLALARRLGFWEEFLIRYPATIFKEHALNNITYYRYYLMVGMDNTPAFDYQSNQLLDEYKEAMIYYHNTFAGTPSADILRAYLDILSKNNHTYNEAVIDFLGQYRP